MVRGPFLIISEYENFHETYLRIEGMSEDVICRRFALVGRTYSVT